MLKLKRRIYGLPIMAPYRMLRTSQLARRHRQHPSGFRFAGQEAFFRESWEASERALLTEQLAKADVFIDVGANQGIYTCLAAAMGVRVAAVEPEAGNLRFLLSNVRENGFADVEIFPVAVAGRSGVARFFGDGDVASLVPGWHNVRETFSQLTPINTLDNLFADRWPDARLLIKIDVEGAELDVLSGAERLLARARKPAWLIETFLINRDPGRTPNRGFRPLFAIMADHGYRCARVDTREAVTLEMVDRWTADPRGHDPGRSNYLFEAG